MKSLKVLSTLSLVTLMSLASVGCGKGSKGDPGAPGQNGSLGTGNGKVVQTIYCSWDLDIVGPYSFLDGLRVEYNAAVTGAGDVYASAAVLEWDSENDQTSAAKVYAKNSLGSASAPVSLRFDPSDTANTQWTISYDRASHTPEIAFFDPLTTTVLIPADPADCTVTNF